MTVDASRTLLVWIFFMLYPKQYSEHEYFDYVQLLGFIVQVVGTLIFNEVLVLPFLGLNKHLSLSKNYAKLIDEPEEERLLPEHSNEHTAFSSDHEHTDPLAHVISPHHIEDES